MFSTDTNATIFGCARASIQGLEPVTGRFLVDPVSG
jgi:hypothetical protein